MSTKQYFEHDNFNMAAISKWRKQNGGTKMAAYQIWRLSRQSKDNK